MRRTKATRKNNELTTNYNDFKARALKNKKLKNEYNKLAPEFAIIQAMIDARISKHITQKDLSEITGITQADISRIENGTRNPSIAMVQRLANGLGIELKLQFVVKE